MEEETCALCKCNVLDQQMKVVCNMCGSETHFLCQRKLPGQSCVSCKQSDIVGLLSNPAVGTKDNGPQILSDDIIPPHEKSIESIKAYYNIHKGTLLTTPMLDSVFRRFVSVIVAYVKNRQDPKYLSNNCCDRWKMFLAKLLENQGVYLCMYYHIELLATEGWKYNHLFGMRSFNMKHSDLYQSTLDCSPSYNDVTLDISRLFNVSLKRVRHDIRKC